MNPSAKAAGLSFQVSQPELKAENDRLHDGNLDRFRPNPEDFTNQGFSWFNLVSSLVKVQSRLLPISGECLTYRKFYHRKEGFAVLNLCIRPFFLSSKEGGFLGVKR